MQAQSTSMMPTSADAPLDDFDVDADGLQIADMWVALRPHLLKVAAAAFIVGACGYGASFLIAPTFTARTTIVSPQQQQNSAASALASLGALSAFGGGAIKSPADQYISIMQSATVSNRIIERFKLQEVYESKFLEDARKRLGDNVRITAGKKDNLIFIEFDDKDPTRAANIANAYVTELRWVTNNLALTEAQQRRAFFEQQLQKTKDALQAAQLRVEKTGFTAGALKSEPRAAAEAYAKTKAEIASNEVKLGALRKTLTESAPEVQQTQATLVGLRGQLALIEKPAGSGGNQDYVSAYREFKYQEALFEIYAKQFELARMDEAREGTLIQVLDSAVKPERKSKPRRSTIALGSALAAALLLGGYFIINGLNRARRS
ncbi:Wzz/FepE/Etk N-terminal domain-containing protein [Burkholderiaceae bacterium UC74_6]